MNKDEQGVVLSIIVISYNTLEMTKACLASIYENCGDLNIQVIVVDNASQDGSVAMIKSLFPQANLIANLDNKGFAAANNQGFKMAVGSYLLLLNSDTVVLGDVIQKSVEYLDLHEEAGAMGCRVLNTDMTMQATCSGYPTLPRLFFLTVGLDRVSSLFDHYLLRAWKRDTERDVEVISGCYLMTRREVLEKVGGLDESFFFFGEETDWCLQMRKAGWILRFVPVGEIIHHGGGSVKKLNHRRDLMLTEATIRLHRKNAGVFSASAVFLVLAVFNWSRAIVWTVRSLIQRHCRQRATHFRLVAAGTLSTWPKTGRGV